MQTEDAAILVERMTSSLDVLTATIERLPIGKLAEAIQNASESRPDPDSDDDIRTSIAVGAAALKRLSEGKLRLWDCRALYVSRADTESVDTVDWLLGILGGTARPAPDWWIEGLHDITRRSGRGDQSTDASTEEPETFSAAIDRAEATLAAVTPAVFYRNVIRTGRHEYYWTPCDDDHCRSGHEAGPFLSAADRADDIKAFFQSDTFRVVETIDERI